MDLESFYKDKVIPDIINSHEWTKLCRKPYEGALQLVRKFYANMEDKVEDKVFVREKWVTMTNEAVNN